VFQSLILQFSLPDSSRCDAIVHVWTFQALASMKEQFQADDHTLLRFLRARQFVVPQAAEMYRNYVQHRKESGIDKILKAQLPKKEEWKDFVPHSFHGFDKVSALMLVPSCPIY